MSAEKPECGDTPSMTVRHGVGAGLPRVEGYCPTCGLRSLFVGAGGYVTCGNLNCSNPIAPSEALGIKFPEPMKVRTTPGKSGPS